MVADGSVGSGSSGIDFPLLDCGVKPFWPVAGFPALHICVLTEFVGVTGYLPHGRRVVECALLYGSVLPSRHVPVWLTGL